jgi:hypothetical protein
MSQELIIRIWSERVGRLIGPKGKFIRKFEEVYGVKIEVIGPAKPKERKPMYLVSLPS